jgi:protein tyrosine kinase modulator
MMQTTVVFGGKTAMASSVSKMVPNARAVEEGGFFGLEHYGFHDYKTLFLRRKWLVVSVTLAVALLTSAVAYFLPNQYKATVVVLVDPSKVAESFVKPTATISAAERLGLLREQILSNTKLSQIIDDMGLYGDLKKTETRDQILLRMRKDVMVEPVTFSEGGLGAFKVSYISKRADTSAQVANRLASLFIEENLRTREQQVIGTADFFSRELEEAKQELALKARKVEELKARYFSELPEAQTVHIQTLTALQLELRAEMDAATRAQQQKVYLQSLLAATPPVINVDSSSGQGGGVALRERSSRLQKDLDELRARYGPEFPDVRKKEIEIQQLQQQLKAEELTASSGPRPLPAMTHHNPVLESQIASITQEITSHEQREEELKSQIAFHESKLEGAPEVAGELAAATREYDNAQDNYKRLQDHKFAADVSSDVENRQKGERFMIVEPAQPPSRPYSPNRGLIDLLGFVGGLPMSVFVVLGLEAIDTSVKTRRELLARMSCPILAEIPWIPTDVAGSRYFLRDTFAWTGNAVLALAYAAFLALAWRH